MTIHLRPDQERRIKEAIRAGFIDSFEQVMEAGLEKLSLAPSPYKTAKAKTLRTKREAADHIREARKGNFLPEGLTIHSLINEGRA